MAIHGFFTLFVVFRGPCVDKVGPNWELGHMVGSENGGSWYSWR